MFQLKDEKRAMATAIAGLIGTLLAVFGIMNHFVPFLIILTSGISPIAGVMIADYWIKLKGNKEQWREREGIHWIGVIAWISGFIVGYFITFGSAPINAIITAMIVNVVLDKIFIKTSQNPEIVNTTQEQ
jgi:cytosine permease